MSRALNHIHIITHRITACPGSMGRLYGLPGTTGMELDAIGAAGRSVASLLLGDGA